MFKAALFTLALGVPALAQSATFSGTEPDTRQVSVGNHDLYLSCLGSGRPTVVLEAFFADMPAFETWDSDAATAQGRTPYLTTGAFGTKPIVVLTRDVKRIDPDGIAWIKANIWAGYSADVDRLYGAAWLELQRDYLTLSSNSAQVIAKGSTHYIQKDRPGLVTEAVRQVVAATREGQPAHLLASQPARPEPTTDRSRSR